MVPPLEEMVPALEDRLHPQVPKSSLSCQIPCLYLACPLLFEMMLIKVAAPSVQSQTPFSGSWKTRVHMVATVTLAATAAMAFI